MEPYMMAAATGIIGAIGAMIWSFLMASKVAAPRAAKKSRLLLVNILTGATDEDKRILETIRGTLVRPEVERMRASMPSIDEEALAIDYEELAKELDGVMRPMVAEEISKVVMQQQAQSAKVTGEFLKQMDLDGHLEGLEAEARQAVLDQAGPQAQVLAELADIKIPKRASAVHKAFLNMVKAQALGMVQAQMPGASAPVEAPVEGNRGIGVR